MRFSVVIATLGRPAILARTLASVARCDLPPHEVIVVDGDAGRSSESATTGEWPFPLRYFTSPPGLPKQRNVGIDRAEGDVVVFIDDDVEIPTDTFTILQSAYSDPTLLGATARIVEPASTRIGKKHSPVRKLLPGGGEEGRFTRFGYPRRLVDLDTERDIDFMHGSFMSVRRTVAADVRFDERLPGYALAEDEDFSYRVSRRGRIRYLQGLHVIHAKEGHGTRDARAFGRTVVINRSYLFRKNFRRSLLARLQFASLIALFMVHRLVNREWAEFAGLVEGSFRALNRPLDAGFFGDGPAQKTRRFSKEGGGVVFVSSHARSGGSERYLETLLSRLETDRIAGVIALEAGPLVESLRSSGLEVRVVPTGGGLLAIARSSFALRRCLSDSGAGVVHANGVKAALASVLARPGVPIVWVKHDFSFDGPLVRFLSRRCAVVVGVSEAVLGALGDKRRQRAVVVHNGVEAIRADRAEARRALRRELGVGEQVHLIGLVGRMHPVKGHEDFVSAALKVARERQDAHFVLVGGRDESWPAVEQKVKNAATALGERAHLLGHRDDITTVMAALDVGVMASHRDGGSNVEAFPLTALEMLACGTPVVAYASGGIPELLGGCGALVPTGNVEALARAIIEVVDDEEKATRMSECGRHRIETEFSLTRMTEQMSEIYEQAAAL